MIIIMTDNQESTRVYYLQQLCDTSLGSNAFKTPWGGLILKNCDSEGKLYEFKNIPEYKESRKQFWLYLSLKVFRYRDHAYPIFCCDECENMKTVENFVCTLTHLRFQNYNVFIPRLEVFW